MKPATLVQQLFAIERAIPHSDPVTLRAMVIEAQEAALRMDGELSASLRESLQQQNRERFPQHRIFSPQYPEDDAVFTDDHGVVVRENHPVSPLRFFKRLPGLQRR
jgi:hypothetical protein